MSCTYRGITIKASGSVNKAVNVLKEEASRALRVIKHNVKKPLWNTGKKKPEAKRDYNVIWPSKEIMNWQQKKKITVLSEREEAETDPNQEDTRDALPHTM